jgi:hypothetical protein
MCKAATINCGPKSLNTPEFKNQAVRLVVAEQGPDESRHAVCDRLVFVSALQPVTLYGWVTKAGVDR